MTCRGEGNLRKPNYRLNGGHLMYHPIKLELTKLWKCY